MDYKDITKVAKEAVADFYTINFPIDDVCVRPEDVYVVWYCKTLQNVKLLLSTDVPDGRYFEATYNGTKEELYFDVYKKESNNCIKM